MINSYKNVLILYKSTLENSGGFSVKSFLPIRVVVLIYFDIKLTKHLYCVNCWNCYRLLTSLPNGAYVKGSLALHKRHLSLEGTKWRHRLRRRIDIWLVWLGHPFPSMWQHFFPEEGGTLKHQRGFFPRLVIQLLIAKSGVSGGFGLKTLSYGVEQRITVFFGLPIQSFRHESNCG